MKAPTEQDYKKLGRVISYLKETVHLLLVIGENNSGTEAELVGVDDAMTFVRRMKHFLNYK